MTEVPGDLRRMVNEARDLLGPPGDRVGVNPEYTRALVELVSRCAGPEVWESCGDADGVRYMVTRWIVHGDGD